MLRDHVEPVGERSGEGKQDAHHTSKCRPPVASEKSEGQVAPGRSGLRQVLLHRFDHVAIVERTRELDSPSSDSGQPSVPTPEQAANLR
jgi:hypothetical protein